MMPTPADRQAEAQEDALRLAQALWNAECATRSEETMEKVICPPWDVLSPRKQGFYLRCSARLLRDGPIASLRRVERHRPLDGQTTIMDTLM